MTEDEAKKETIEHINQVRVLLYKIIIELKHRLKNHDESKLSEAELPGFAKYTEKLKDCTYGSEEYKQNLSEMKPYLDHHYTDNRHHPEHFKKYVCNGCFKEYEEQKPNVCTICGYSQMQEECDISQMNLVDLIEMICDWTAATKRHADGDIHMSIELNQERFGYPDMLKRIFHKTVKFLKAPAALRTEQ